MKYRDLAEIIQKDIEGGHYRESGKLPTEDELMDEYNVTRYCVRNAIQQLVNLGMVYQIQGSGVFIRENVKEGCISLSSTKGIKGEFPDSKVESKLIKMIVRPADEEIARKMKCPIGVPIYDIIRLRIVDGKKYALEYTLYNKEIIPDVSSEVVEQSIYEYIREDLKLNMGFSDKIVSCEKINKEASTLLDLQKNDPGLVIESVAYLLNGKVFNVSKVIYNYKFAKLFELVKMN